MRLAVGSRETPRPVAWVGSDTFAPRLTIAINIVVVTAVLLIQLINVSQVAIAHDGQPIGSGARAGCYIAIAALFVLQLVHSSRRLRPSATWLLGLSLGLQAVISYLPTIYLGEAWGGAAGFLLGSVLLLIQPAWIAFGVFGLFEVLTAMVAMADDQVWTNVVYAVVANGLTAFVIYSVSKMAEIVTDLHTLRRELATRAVEEERQRFSRDLHDLLGYSLSAIALKGELAHLTIDSAPEEAKDQITSILGITRIALQDVRSVARSYRAISLSAQLASARSMLTSAGIEGTSQPIGTLLPGPCETVLATVVREGVTNVIRHSKAETCDILVSATADTVSLDVVNDGVHESLITRYRQGEEPTEFGDGLGGLRNLGLRLRQVHGSLRCYLDDQGRFVLSATVPTRLTPIDRPDPVSPDRTGNPIP